MYFRRRFSPFGRRGRSSVLFICASVAVLTVIVMLIADARVRPIIRQIAESQAQTLAARAIDNAVTQVLSRDGTDYDDLMQITTDADGRITSIRSKTVEINKLKAELSETVLNAIEKYDKKKISIPFGTVIGSDLFAGRGPKLKLYITLSASTIMQISNVFESTGINQTRHQILLNVEAKIYIIMTGGNMSTTLNTNFIVAETVIVGSVPDTYFSGIEQRSTSDVATEESSP